MARKHQFINARTGEVADGLLVVKGSRYPRNTDFSVVFHDGMEFLAQLDLTPTESKVFWVLLGNMEYENWVRITQATLADRLGMARSNFSRAVKGLVDHRIVLWMTDPADPKRKLLRVSLQVAWRGKASGWLRAVNEVENTSFASVPRRVSAKPAKMNKQRSKGQER
ncbi:MAG TPA: hypothetical protein VM639_23720 [Dongiaceae bacterium]|nr:hypothetical protein [Dongiaceae bacterium]